MTTTATRRQAAAAPSTDVFARTVPLLLEKHYFGESKKASMAPVSIDGQTAAEQARTKAMLTLSKRLLNSEELRKVRYRDIEFRDYLRGVSTPFRPGLYLVPLALVEAVDEAARTWEAERAALVEAAAVAYPAHVQAMREPLGPLFNPLDYPPAGVFRSKFWVDWRFVDFGVASVLREVRADIFRRETEKLQRQAGEARTLIEQHLRGSLLEITAHLRDLLGPKASGKRPQLRDNCLERLMGFLATVEQRDVTGDESLQRVVARLRKLSTGLDLEVLRDDEDVRDATAKDMALIAAQVERLVVEGPARGIRFRDDVEVAS